MHACKTHAQHIYFEYYGCDTSGQTRTKLLENRTVGITHTDLSGLPLTSSSHSKIKYCLNLFAQTT